MPNRSRASQQRQEALRGFAQQGQHAFDGLFGGFLLHGHAHAQCSNDRAFVVAQGHGHTSVSHVELLLRQAPVLFADLLHLLTHDFHIGDGVRGEGAQRRGAQPRVDCCRALQRNQQHARRRGVSRHARAQGKAGVHAAVLSIARDVNNVVPIEHANKRNFLCTQGHALQRGLYQAGQTRRLQVRLSQAHDLGREPKQFAIAGDKAQMLQSQQIAASRGAGQATTLTRLTSGLPRMRLVEGLDQGQAFFQACNPVAFVEWGERVAFNAFVSSRHVSMWWKPLEGSMIAQECSLIAQSAEVFFKSNRFQPKFLHQTGWTKTRCPVTLA